MEEVLEILAAEDIVEFDAHRTWLRTREMVQTKTFDSMQQTKKSSLTFADVDEKQSIAGPPEPAIHEKPTKMLSLDGDSDSDWDEEEIVDSDDW